ncbi:MAG: hypothetical protein BZY80_00805 [SAR202 cluster bacterium Io17-Chloro-G2]|nr:MAG: hypothetical protein BZY80_00805 [SAR202 cluster bacterium Io17-Chloro-G2]
MLRADYVRLFTDGFGESRFEDLDIALSPVDLAPPAGPLNVAQFLPATQSFWVGVPAGWAGEVPHPSPQRQIFVVVQGEFEVTASDGAVRLVGPGGVLLMEDTWGIGHSTRLTGNGGGLIFAVALGDVQ